MLPTASGATQPVSNLENRMFKIPCIDTRQFWFERTGSKFEESVTDLAPAKFEMHHCQRLATVVVQKKLCAMTRRWIPKTCYTLGRNTASNEKFDWLVWPMTFNSPDRNLQIRCRKSWLCSAKISGFVDLASRWMSETERFRMWAGNCEKFQQEGQIPSGLKEG